MDHPLRSENYIELRRAVYKTIQEAFTIPRQSNIVFVCGGNDQQDMRRQFQDKFSTLLPGFEFFEPEFAMRKYLTLGDSEPFDITVFEELIGELSHSIVIFPEAPGSLAETGYFSAKEDIARKILLVMNEKHLTRDSFISIGPAKKNC
ncbi:retron St85 family effector protein [Oceanibaculum indicum]|uniref:retron St85 family effector protein n=1 Tax=Oceanibaculum indicum TaxID=526216 RepID=UPI0011C435BD|nr:retron St85 family effector protein [Oceanibaculum indicum]